MTEAPYLAILDNAGENLSIKNIALTGEEQIIPVRIEAGVSGVYSLEVRGLNGFARGARITLEDVFTNAVYVLSEDVAIELPLVAGDMIQRYQLRIGATPDSVREKQDGQTEITELSAATQQNNQTQIVLEEQPAINNESIDASNSNQFAAAVVGALTKNGVQLNFLFNEMRNIRISAYNVLGQQLIEPIVGQYGRQTITLGDSRFAAHSIIEVTDLKSGERTLIRLGL